MKRRWFKDAFLQKSLALGVGMKFGDIPNTGAPHSRILCGIRPAFSKDRDTVIATVYLAMGKIPAQDVYYLLDIKRQRCTSVEELKFIAAYIQQLEPSEVRIDLECDYKHFISLLQEKLLPDFPIPKFMSHRKDNLRFLTPLGVQRLSGLLVKGVMVLPSDFTDPHTKEQMDILQTEMRAYPNRPIGSSLFALTLACMGAIDHLRPKISIPENDPAMELLERANEQRAPQEKEVDLAKVLEQEYERSNFRRMMGGNRYYY